MFLISLFVCIPLEVLGSSEEKMPFRYTLQKDGSSIYGNVSAVGSIYGSHSFSFEPYEYDLLVIRPNY